MKPPLPLPAVDIRVDPHLVGSKRAVQFGDGPIIVGPAMWELMKAADPDELQRLLRAIPLLRLPAMPDLTSLPMTVIPFRDAP